MIINIINVISSHTSHQEAQTPILFQSTKCRGPIALVFQFSRPLNMAYSCLSPFLCCSWLTHLFPWSLICFWFWIITSTVCCYESSFPWAHSDLYIDLVIYETPSSNQAPCGNNKDMVSWLRPSYLCSLIETESGMASPKEDKKAWHCEKSTQSAEDHEDTSTYGTEGAQAAFK